MLFPVTDFFPKNFSPSHDFHLIEESLIRFKVKVLKMQNQKLDAVLKSFVQGWDIVSMQERNNMTCSILNKTTDF